MLRIGLTGGIASGKSTVAARFAQLGAVVVDADVLAREVVAPGTPGLAAVLAEFGPEVGDPVTGLDRAALGRLVFTDPQARQRLEGILHPLVREAGDAAEADVRPGQVVVHDIPLLVEKGYAPRFHAVLVTEEEAEERVRRMVATRGLTGEEARRRIAAQASDSQRRAVADMVLPGGEDVSTRLTRIDELWGERLRPWAENIADARTVRRPTPAALHDHDPRWRAVAARQLRRLRFALDAAGMAHETLGLDHIGSTAVPGVPAKDVIDLQIRLRAWDDVTGAPLRDALAAAGFFPRADGWYEDHVHPALSADAREWRKVVFRGTDPAQVYHVHARVHSHAAARCALLMRDYLRADVHARASYAEAKRAAAATEATAVRPYTEAKAPWFACALPAALAWASRTGWRGPGPG